jgi:putative aldouronate transport system substrate-binding protein
MVLSAADACTQQQTQQAPEAPAAETPAEDYTINILTVSHEGSLIAEDHPAWLQLEEYTGYNIELDYVLNADYADQMNARLLSQDLPGLVTITGLTGPIIQAIRGGAFWDITDVYKNYQYLAMANESVMDNSSVDGRYWGIYRRRTYGRAGISYRQDWAENVGLGENYEPQTLDDLYEMLTRFTNDDPDGNGQDDTIGVAWTGGHLGPFFYIAASYGAPNRWGIRDGQFTPWFEYDEFYEALEYCKRMYDDGLINTDFAATSTSDWTQAFPYVGKSGVHIDLADEANRFATNLRDNGFITQEQVDDGSVVWVVGSLESPSGERFSLPTSGYAGIVSISTSGAPAEADRDHYLNFMNYTNDEVGINLLNHGAEGTNYTLDEDGFVVRIPAEEIPNGWNDLAGWNQFMTDVGIPMKTVKNNPRQLRQEEIYLENAEIAVDDPSLPFQVLSETWNLNSNVLNQIVYDAIINYMMGTIDRDGFDAEMERWYNEGGTQVQADFQAQYDAVN